jgi:hypothetical protein
MGKPVFWQWDDMKTPNVIEAGALRTESAVHLD